MRKMQSNIVKANQARKTTSVKTHYPGNTPTQVELHRSEIKIKNMQNFKQPIYLLNKPWEATTKEKLLFLNPQA